MRGEGEGSDRILVICDPHDLIKIPLVYHHRPWPKGLSGYSEAGPGSPQTLFLSLPPPAPGPHSEFLLSEPNSARLDRRRTGRCQRGLKRG